MALKNPEKRFWRTDDKHGRSIYALVTNDPFRPSDNDQFMGVMENSTMADEVVRSHNALLTMYGPRYLGIVEADAKAV